MRAGRPTRDHFRQSAGTFSIPGSKLASVGSTGDIVADPRWNCRFREEEGTHQSSSSMLYALQQLRRCNKEVTHLSLSIT